MARDLGLRASAGYLRALLWKRRGGRAAECGWVLPGYGGVMASIGGSNPPLSAGKVKSFPTLDRPRDQPEALRTGTHRPGMAARHRVKRRLRRRDRATPSIAGDGA